jgi:hypothetical protein
MSPAQSPIDVLSTPGPVGLTTQAGAPAAGLP